MKSTTRIRRGIIQSLLFSVLFLFILIVSLTVFAYPRIIEIEEKKQELSEIFTKYNKTLVSGISYAEFKKNQLDGSESDYTRVLLQNVDESFYNLHFTNTSEPSYTEYLNTVESNISDIKTSDEYILKNKNLNIFLPTYSKNNDGVVGGDTNSLTDFYFINYIENLLYSFNLSYDGNIGVGEIQNVDISETPEKIQQRDLLEENIFAIPLEFSITGAKYDIVDFLHYFENVAKIEISEDGFIVPNDRFINKTIEGSITGANYNIYENQLADITYLSASEYPNSSTKTASSLSYAMKTLQGKERYDLDIGLNFYVSGVPGYKMQEFINNFFETYELFTSDVKKNTQKFISQKYKFSNSEQLTSIQGLQNIESLVIAMQDDVISLKKSMAQGKDIEQSYSTAVEYAKQLDRIKYAYQSQLEILLK